MTVDWHFSSKGGAYTYSFQIYNCWQVGTAGLKGLIRIELSHSLGSLRNWCQVREWVLMIWMTIPGNQSWDHPIHFLNDSKWLPYSCCFDTRRPRIELASEKLNSQYWATMDTRHSVVLFQGCAFWAPSDKILAMNKMRVADVLWRNQTNCCYLFICSFSGIQVDYLPQQKLRILKPYYYYYYY